MTPNLLDELAGVVKFLLGEGELNGRWFGDEPPVTASGLKRRYWWRDDLRKAHATLADMAKRLEALQSLAAAMYQAAGAYDMPVRFLDVLSAAGNGEPITEEQVDALLPCETPDTLQRLEAAERDAARWLFFCDEYTHGYGDGYTEPEECHAELQWQQGPWIRDGSNGGAGRKDTFPGWDAIIDEAMEKQRLELADLDESAAIDATQEGEG